MCIASQSDITDFLFKFKFFAQDLSKFIFVERDKNIKAIAELGITIAQTQATILDLTYINYIAGPDVDEGYPDHNVWKFGYNLNTDELYIKLSDNFNYNIAKCISFHKADFVISYPYGE